jgi:hypothetical protein
VGGGLEQFCPRSPSVDTVLCVDNESLNRMMDAVVAAESDRERYLAPYFAEIQARQVRIAQATELTSRVMTKIGESIRVTERMAIGSVWASPLIAEHAHRALADLEAIAKRNTAAEMRLRERLPAVVLDLDVDDCEAAKIAEEEGIPLAWVPRLETVRDLLALGDAEARFAHLEGAASDVLEYCKSVANHNQLMWMSECTEAANALQAGYPAAAQSLAANVIDTIVRTVGGHSTIISRAKKPIDDDDPFLAFAELIVIKPILRSMVSWYPNMGQPIPDHFSRHTTAHAMGHPGVSSRLKALIAVMFATSLARQFALPIGGSVPAP